jgi:TRAP-type C4-dicarboxylate transport system permease small subunit
MRFADVIRTMDRAFLGVIRFVCVVLLILMTGFILYTVVMRYVFQDPPFWGDTLAVFANIWLVLMAFSLAVYDREHIAMQGMYDRIPPVIAFAFRFLWDIVILAMGIFMLVYGLELAGNIRGSYHELSGLQKKWPMVILPLFGVLTIIAVLSPIMTSLVAIFSKDVDGRLNRQPGDK